MIIRISGQAEIQLICDICGGLDFCEELEGYYCCNGECDGFYSYYDLAELITWDSGMISEDDV